MFDLNRIAAATTVACTLLLLPGCGKTNGGGGKAPAPKPTTMPAQDDATNTSPPTPTVTPAAQGWTPKDLPSYWYDGDLARWIDQPWREFELFQFMTTEPEGLDEGTNYVVFYRRSCDHCEEMFNDDLALDATLASHTLAVEVPEEADKMHGDIVWTMPKTECRHAQLPVGANWIMQTPLTLRIENGVITCIVEGDHRECMGLPEKDE